MKRACVIGWPVEHSRSPLIHRYWLKQYGIDGAYEKEAVRPEELARFLGSLGAEGFVGANVTLPHKEAALRLPRWPTTPRARSAPPTRCGSTGWAAVRGQHRRLRLHDQSQSSRRPAGTKTPAGDGARRGRRGARDHPWPPRSRSAEVLACNRTRGRADALAEPSARASRRSTGSDRDRARQAAVCSSTPRASA